MLLILGVLLLVAFAVSLLRGGKLRNLASIELRLWWLLPAALVLQTIAQLLPSDRSWSSTVAVILLLSSFPLMLILAWANRYKAGIWIAGIGVLLNFTVIALNGGMPILPEAVEIAGGQADFAAGVQSGEIELDAKHVLLDESSRVPFLADVIPMPGSVVSLGDVLLVVGLGVFLEEQLRRPPRLFQHGLKGEPGSAARQ